MTFEEIICSNRRTEKLKKTTFVWKKEKDVDGKLFSNASTGSLIAAEPSTIDTVRGDKASQPSPTRTTHQVPSPLTYDEPRNRIRVLSTAGSNSSSKTTQDRQHSDYRRLRRFSPAQTTRSLMHCYIRELRLYSVQ